MNGQLNGNGIAFIFFTALCAGLEIFASGAGNLWIVVVLWALFGEFSIKDKQ